MARRNVAVLGGGYTGLVAALRLAQAGVDVTVLEAGSAVGGLASGFSIEGEPIERAYHHLFRTDESILRLVDELGISDRLEWHVSRQAMIANGRLYPFGGALDLLRFDALPLVDRLRTGLTVLRLQRTNRWRPLATVTALDWVTRNAGAASTRVIWEPLLRGKFSRYYDSVAMAWLWARIHTRGNSRSRFELRERLGYFDGGFAVVTDALAAAVRDAGGTIETDAPVAAARSAGSKVVVATASGEREYDACVATLPNHVFSRVVQGAPEATDEYRRSLEAIDYLGARMLVFSSSQSLSSSYWHNITDLSLPFLVFIQHDNLVGTARYGAHVYYVAGYFPTDHPLFVEGDAEVERQWFDGLRRVFPAFDESAVREKHHFRFANAQHIVTTDYEARVPARRTPVPGVYLSNFTQIYPEDRGTNFAVREGELVAADVLQYLAGRATA